MSMFISHSEFVMFRYYFWRKMKVIEYVLGSLLICRFDFLRTTCFDRENHTLYVLQPNMFKVIDNFTYIGMKIHRIQIGSLWVDDPKLKIRQLQKVNVVKPLLQSYYLILNGNDDQMRKMASQLFGFDTSTLSQEEFVPYHQLLWFMSAILPYEKHRIFGRVCNFIGFLSIIIPYRLERPSVMNSHMLYYPTERIWWRSQLSISWTPSFPTSTSVLWLMS